MSLVECLKRDVLAGVVVALVALPLCLGIALASNAPLMSGLIAGIVGGIVVALLSGSQTSVSGPSAGLAAIVAAQIARLDSFELFSAAVVFAGLLQFVFGALRAGFIAAFFPNCVIKGLLAGIGLLLIFKQIPHLVGSDSDPTGDFAFLQVNNETTLSQLLGIFSELELGALFLGIFSLAILMLAHRVNTLNRIPVPLTVVVAGILLNALFQAFIPQLAVEASHLVTLPPLDSSLEKSLLPSVLWRAFQDSRVLTAGFTIAVIASLETLLSLNAVDKLDPLQRCSPPNRELCAQGLGNITSGILGGLPLTSAIIRSSVNISIGNVSKLSAFFHGALLLAAVSFFPELLNSIPLACLAAILIATGFKLASPRLARRMWQEGPDQFIPFLLTVLGILFLDLLTGICVGFLVAIGFILFENYKRGFTIEAIPGEKRNIIQISLPQHVSFLAKPSLERSLRSLPEHSTVRIDASKCDFVDSDIRDLIADFCEQSSRTKGCAVELVGLPGVVPE